ncbi:hypothetical protein PBY51_010785 [Eleginops maclovinus]|uniref:Uncharacterized protein n=1 Tax=Eleginops maclovinus TaxID=56733 RepID=A0AAN8ACE9_ELEMC|nr:hypothetical protein PBY51_010785 [Eleginops maclovinus]
MTTKPERKMEMKHWKQSKALADGNLHKNCKACQKLSADRKSKRNKQKCRDKAEGSERLHKLIDIKED